VSLNDGVSTSRSYTVTGLTNGTTYRFRVAARNAVGWGPVSNFVAAAPAATVPSAPRALTATVGSAVGSGRVRLSWSAPSSNGGLPITDYVIQRSSDRGLTWVSLRGDGVSTVRSYTATGLTNGRPYWFRVAARNAVGWGLASNVVAAIPRQTVPSAPRALTAAVGSGIGSGRVRLSWTAPSSNGGMPITDYVIQRSSTAGRTWVQLADGVSTSRTYTGSGLTNGVTYWFRVAARNAVGRGPLSAVVTATPRAPTSVAVLATTPEPSTTVVDSTTTSVVTGPTTVSAAATTTTTTTGPATSTSSTPPPTTTTTVVATAPPSSDAGRAEDEPSTSEPTTVPTSEVTTTTETTVAPSVESTTTRPPTTITVPVPAVQAPGCPAPSADDVQRVNAALGAGGLTLAAATAGDDGAVRYIVGSIYDGAGALVAAAATWVVSDGELMALGDAANQYSHGLGDARAVLTGPNTGLASRVQIDLAACATAAVSGG